MKESDYLRLDRGQKKKKNKGEREREECNKLIWVFVLINLVYCNGWGKREIMDLMELKKLKKRKEAWKVSSDFGC